jgi:hypothetical protein
MRNSALALVAVCLVLLSGCGCLENYEDRNLTRYGGGGPDPDQPAWHRCLFGTRFLPGRPRHAPAADDISPRQ